VIKPSSEARLTLGNCPATSLQFLQITRVVSAISSKQTTKAFIAIWKRTTVGRFTTRADAQKGTPNWDIPQPGFSRPTSTLESLKPWIEVSDIVRCFQLHRTRDVGNFVDLYDQRIKGGKEQYSIINIMSLFRLKSANICYYKVARANVRFT